MSHFISILNYLCLTPLIRRITDGKAEAYGYFKYLDPDGDFFFMEGKAAEGEVIMKFLSGTGK